MQAVALDQPISGVGGTAAAPLHYYLVPFVISLVSLGGRELWFQLDGVAASGTQRPHG